MKKKEKQNSKTKDKTRILIVDDHPIVRNGLAELLNHEADLVVNARAGNSTEAMESIKKQRIGLAIVDMLLKDETGVQVIQKIKALCPNLIVMIFSMSDNPQYVKQAIEAGARGYIMKDEISEDIVKAIRQVLKGQLYISDRLLKNLSKEEFSNLLAEGGKNQ